MSNQQQLRELNDLNWERFKAELRAGLAQSEARLGDKIAHLEVRVGEKHSEIMKWMFLYWLGSLVPLGGLVVALLRR